MGRMTRVSLHGLTLLAGISRAGAAETISIDRCRDVLISHLRTLEVTNWSDLDSKMERFFVNGYDHYLKEVGETGGGGALDVLGLFKIDGSGKLTKQRYETLKTMFESGQKDDRVEKVLNHMNRWEVKPPPGSAIAAWLACMTHVELKHACRQVGKEILITLYYDPRDINRDELTIKSVKPLGLAVKDQGSLVSKAVLKRGGNASGIFVRNESLQASDIPSLTVLFEVGQEPFEIAVFDSSDCRPPAPSASPTGACCNRETGCRSPVLKTECVERNDQWTAGLGCNELNPPCEAPPTGACCDSSFVCSERVKQANCTGRWVQDKSCSQLSPPCRAPSTSQP